MTDPILALVLATPCPVCGAAASEPCRGNWRSALSDLDLFEEVITICSGRLRAYFGTCN